MRDQRLLRAVLFFVLLSAGALASPSADAHDGGWRGLSDAARQASAAPQAGGPTAVYSGWFHVIYGDATPGAGAPGISGYVLIDDQDQVSELLVDEMVLRALGGPRAINRHRVTVTGKAVAPSTGPLPLVEVDAIQAAASPAARAPEQAVSGPQKWVTILCRFADATGVTPHPTSWFETLMFGSAAAPGLDHYWREVSSNTVNLVGSEVHGWYNLPQLRSYYVPGGNLDHQRAVNDCTAAADADVFFPSFIGINLAFNQDLDCCAWGGSWSLTRDGQTKTYRVTWLPPWGYENQGVVAHEMGHGFGLPHSSGPYTQTYDSEWDVMSGLWGNCPPYDPTYGCVGVHTIAYHKDILGWIPSSQRSVVGPGTSQTIMLERLGVPTSASNSLMAQVPIGGSSTQFYTAETRRFVGYDATLPGQAVVIHRVDTTRSDRDAQVVDADGNGNPNDAGAMWLTGETFLDSANNISVTVNSQVGNAFQVTVSNNATGYTLSVTVTGTGTVTSNPPGISCSAGTCGTSFPSGTSVTLTPSGGSFSTWGGACAGVPSGPCTVSMTQNRSVTATFAAGSSSFLDVPTSHWAWQFVEAVVDAGIMSPCGTQLFCPNTAVTRDNMAVFLEKGIRGSAFVPPAATGVFADVPPTHWAAAWIEQLFADGITAGCGGGNYCPSGLVTRAQMAIFLLRAKHGAAYAPPPASGDFADVPVSYWAAAWIEQLAAEGITAGCGTNPLRYCPEGTVTRAEMAVFLVRTFNLPL